MAKRKEWDPRGPKYPLTPALFTDLAAEIAGMAVNQWGEDTDQDVMKAEPGQFYTEAAQAVFDARYPEAEKLIVQELGKPPWKGGKQFQPREKRARRNPLTQDDFMAFSVEIADFAVQQWARDTGKQVWVEEDNVQSYTEEAQDVFNERYGDSDGVLIETLGMPGWYG